MPQLSVIIPTYNRIDQLQKVLQGLETQSLAASDFEVIVVSDGSTDGTYGYLCQAHFPYQLRAIEQINQGPAAARNLGVQQAASDIIVFLDDDVLPDPDLLKVHLDSQTRTGLTHITMGPLLTPNDVVLSPWVAWEQRLLERYYRKMIEGVFQPSAREFFTGNVSLKKTFLLANGGFDVTFRRAEDVEFAYRVERLGAQFEFNPKAMGYHYALRSYASWLQTPYLYGKYEVIFTLEKGVKWLLPTKMKEYHRRHRLIKLLVPICLDHKTVQAVVMWFFHWLGVRSYPKNRAISNAAFSAIYNLQYYQGISDQLGGRKVFFSYLKST